MHDLLEDPLISVLLSDGETKRSLPGLLAELSTGRVRAYPRLREHQQDPFHVLTVQLAASVLSREGRESPSTDAEFWRRGLLALADGQPSAWHLVEEDPTKPAFLQPPCISAGDFRSSFTPKALTPDELDTLDTAKDHDVKGSRAASDALDLWIAALICSQTTCGYFGSGKYGIFRMNSGAGCRSIITTVRNPQPGPRFLEELPHVLEMRLGALSSHYGYVQRGVILTWLKPWDRQGPLHHLSDLEPTFIEAARSIRLVHKAGNLSAWGAGNKTRQIGGPENGDCGDPWTALRVDGSVNALTVSRSGLTPQLLTSLLFEQGFQLTPLQRPRTGSGITWFCASVLVRGHTPATAGFHSIRLPIPERARTLLTSARERDLLSALARRLLLDCAIAENDCLKAALVSMVKGGVREDDVRKALKPKAKRHDQVIDWARKSATALQQRWKHAYFPTLWDAADLPAETVRARWAMQLVNHAREILDEAERTVPIPSSRRLRAAVRARSVLEATLAKSGLIELTKESR